MQCRIKATLFHPSLHCIPAGCNPQFFNLQKDKTFHFMQQNNSGKSVGFSATLKNSVSNLRRKSDRKPSRLSGSMALLGGLFLLSLQLFTTKANAIAIPTGSFSCTQSTTTTTACGAGGVFASGWTSGAGQWTYTLNTTGYTGIAMSFSTKSSGTGPTTGDVYYNTGTSGDVLWSNYSN